LIAKPEQVATLLGLFRSMDDCVRAVATIVKAGLVPRCLEVLDESCVMGLRREGAAIDERASALLIMEVDGDAASCEQQLQQVGGRATDAGAIDVLVAQDEAQRARVWDARRQLSQVTRRMARYKIAEDVVVPRGKLAALVNEVSRIGERNGVRTLTYGHAGDGNLHVNFLWDDPADDARVATGLDELFRTVIAMRGTLSGEHGIGTSKSEFLALEQSRELILLQQRIKATFDPKGILNPGKIFPRSGHGSC
jgi:glycolate oxidase